MAGTFCKAASKRRVGCPSNNLVAVTIPKALQMILLVSLLESWP